MERFKGMRVPPFTNKSDRPEVRIGRRSTSTCGYLNMTGTDEGGATVHGAVNIPNQFQSIEDAGDFFGPGTAAFLQGYGNLNSTQIVSKAHELRVSFEERWFGFS